jgi:hypothetical protein
MSHSYDDNDYRRHDHHHGVVGSILDFIEDEDALKAGLNQSQTAVHQDTMVCSHCKMVIPSHSKFCRNAGSNKLKPCTAATVVRSWPPTRNSA